MLKVFKHLLKNNELILSILSRMIYYYLQIVYMTSSWNFVLPKGYTKCQFLKEHGTIFALWHNRLALGPGIFKELDRVAALISPHSDGRIISSVIKNFSIGIISGSTHKNPIGALRSIIKNLSDGTNIVITPDGPLGPVYKINSSITHLAKKHNARLIPLSCDSTRYFLLNSWDKLIIPLPFGKIEVRVGVPLQLSDNMLEDNKLLEYNMLQLDSRSIAL